MTKHLTNATISNLLAHAPEAATETAAFEHWSICQTCQTKLRQAIERNPPWSYSLTANTQLFETQIAARWPFWIISTANALLALTSSESEHQRQEEYLRRQDFRINQSPAPNFLRETGTILRDFMQNGKRFHISAFNFFLVRTAFARQILTWTGLVPFGKTATYGQIARWSGHPTAARGVGGALHSNPLALVIPCHRIIGSNGALIGFGGGLDMKQKLLELEGSYPQI